MDPDIAGADRPQERVGQRVQADIGIGMADKARVMRDRDAADHDVVAGAERMHVEALADPDIAEARGEEPLRRGEVLRGRHLQIVLAPLNHERRHPGGLGDRRIVGQHASDCGAVRRENGREMKALRGLRAPQSGAVDGVLDPALLNPLHRVAKREGGDRGGRGSEAVEDAVDQRGVGKGARAVVDQHARGIMGDQRFEAEPHRILPLGPARHRRQQREARNGFVEQDDDPPRGSPPGHRRSAGAPQTPPRRGAARSCRRAGDIA